MNESDDHHPSSEAQGKEPIPVGDGSGPPHRVNYGRLVNILAAATERLSRRGHTVTEAQTRIILKRVRNRAPDGIEADHAEYRLEVLAETAAEVAGVDDAYMRSVLKSVVEPDQS